jgi:hypothetical protein
MTVTMRGSCQCGNVKYTASEPPLGSFACHCLECQKLSASAFSTGLVFRAVALIVEGDLNQWVRSSGPGKTNTAYFCPTCGNRIYHVTSDRPDLKRLKSGTLDDAFIPPPIAHLWVSRRQPWVQIPDDVAQFEENLSAEFLRQLDDPLQSDEV